MKKVINERVLESSLRLLELHDQQLRSIEAMRKSVEVRAIALQEFVRANYTGDTYAFGIIKEAFVANKGGPGRRIYDNGAYDHVQTRMLVKKVREEYPLTVDQSTEVQP